MHSEIQASESYLKRYLRPDSRIYCIIRHVAPSGTMRVIDMYTLHDGRLVNIGWHAATVLGYSWSKQRSGMRVQGTGMNMAFEATDSLKHRLFDAGITQDYEVI